MTSHSQYSWHGGCVAHEWAAEYLQSKPMLKQFGSFNTYVFRETHSCLYCDGLCAEQTTTTAIDCTVCDIAVVCSKLSQNSHSQHIDATQDEVSCVERLATTLASSCLLLVHTPTARIGRAHRVQITTSLV
jgi:hypothetical protein